MVSANVAPARNHLTVVVLLALLGVAFVVLVNPTGNFPLNDDWNYALGVNGILTEHQLFISDGASPS